MLSKTTKLAVLISVIMLGFGSQPAFCDTWVLKEDLMAASDQPNTFFEFFYNDNCNRIREETDYGNDGSIDIISQILYNDKQQKVEKRVDNGADGSVDYVVKFSWDAYGNNTKVEYDTDNDGIIEMVRYKEFNEAGQHIRTKQDNTNDGSIDSVTEYEYDEHGNIIKTKKDSDNDGDFETVNITEYTYSEGNMIVQKTRALESETWASRTRYYYEGKDHDNPTRIELDKGADGTIDQTNEMTYIQCSANGDDDGGDDDGDGSDDENGSDDEDGSGGGGSGCFVQIMSRAK